MGILCKSYVSNERETVQRLDSVAVIGPISSRQIEKSERRQRLIVQCVIQMT